MAGFHVVTLLQLSSWAILQRQTSAKRTSSKAEAVLQLERRTAVAACHTWTARLAAEEPSTASHLRHDNFNVPHHRP